MIAKPPSNVETDKDPTIETDQDPIVETDQGTADTIETSDSVDQKSLDQKQVELDSIQQQIALVEDILAKQDLSPEDKDAKKKEVEGVLIKAKQEIATLKADTTLTDGQKKDLDSYQKKLGELESSIKPWYEKIWDTVTEVTNKTVDLIKEHPKTSLAIVGSLGIYGLYKLFSGSGDKKEEKKDENTEKTPWYKKWYTWVLGGIGGVALWKNWGSLSDWIKGLFGKEQEPGTRSSETPGSDPESMAKQFETLSDQEKKQYNRFGNAVNEYQTAIVGENTSPLDVLGGSDYDDGKPGLVPFILNNRYDSLDGLISESTGYYEIFGLESHKIVAQLKGWTADQLKTLFMPVAEKVDGLASRLGGLGATKSLDDFLAFVAGNPKLVSHIESVFRKSFTVMTYLSGRKRLLQYKLAEKALKNDPDFQKADAQQKASLITQKINDTKWYDTHIKPTMDIFNKKRLYAAIDMLAQYDILNSTLDVVAQKEIDRIDEQRNKLLDYDPNDPDNGTLLDRMQEKIRNGTLDESDKKELINIIDTVLEDMSDQGSYAFYTKYIPLLSIFGGSEQLNNEIYASGQYEALMQGTRDSLVAIRENINKGVVQESDIATLSACIDEYFAFLKQLEVQNMEMSYIVDDDGNLIIKGVMRVGFALKRAGENIYIGMSAMIKNGDRSTENGALVLGGVVSFLPFLYPVKTLKYTGKALSFTLKNATRLAVVAAGKSGSLAGRYIYAPSRLLKYAYSGTGHGYQLLKHDLARGVISIQEVEKLFVGKKGLFTGWQGLDYTFDSETIGSLDDFLRKMFPGFDGDRKMLHTMLEKYGSNKHVRNAIITSDYRSHKLDPRKWVDWDKSRLAYKIDASMLKKVHDMHVRIDGIKDVYTQTVLQNVLLHTKDLAKAENILILSMDTKYVKFLTDQGIDAAQFGKYIGKYSKSVDQIEDVVKYMQEAKTAGKLNNPTTFARNTIAHWGKLKGMTQQQRLDTISSMKLNSSFLDRRIAALKEGMLGAAEKLKLLKVRSPYPQQVDAVAQSLTELASVSDDAFRGMTMTESIGQANRLSVMSGNTKLIQEIKPLFANKDFVNALSKAKTPDAVKAVFTQFDKGHLVKDMPDEFIGNLSRTKNSKNLVNTMHYVEHYKTLGRVGKILQNPAMRSVGRILGKALIVGGTALAGYDVYSTWSEAQELKKHNVARGDTMQQKAVVTGFFEAVILAGAITAATGPATLGTTTIVGGVLVTYGTIGRMISDSTYGVLDRYNMNYQDFLGKAPLQIKQHILQYVLGTEKYDRGFGDWLVGHFKDLGPLASKASSNAMKGLLYTEEWNRNPLATIDITNTDLMNQLAKENPPITREDVAQAVNEVESRVSSRYAYLEKKCGVYTDGGKTFIDIKKYISLQDIQQYNGMQILDTLLLESIYSANNPDTLDSPQHIQKQKESLATDLEKQPALLRSLDTLWKKDPISLLYMYHHRHTILGHIQGFGSQDSAYDTIMQHATYFDHYMVHKSLDQGVVLDQYQYTFGEPDHILKTGRDFFVDYRLTKPFSSQEIYGDVPKVYVALYRIATEVVGASLSPTIADLLIVFSEINEESTGIYFKDNDPKKLCINGNYFSDSEHSGVDRQTLVSMRGDIAKLVASNDLIKVGTGTKIFNQEMGKKYLAIIDQEIARI